MNEIITTFFGLVGGLALFLFGMNSMSDALQKAAGAKMKKILGLLTRNPLMGALAGALVTAVLQSSSATTVMVIGFVSAGLMSLPQGISVIFGANIGTTMTAQLIAFEISDYIYPILFAGFLMYFAGKKEKIKNIGMVIFSFGLLFEGIEIMGSVMKPLAESPVFVDLMGKVADVPALGVLLGTGMTVVVQSSSATIAVLQNFAAQAGPDGVTSIIGLSGAIPILLGANIGTTITAFLASIGQSRDAKRTAAAHSIFNISGSIVFLFLIPALTKFVQLISPKGNEVDVISRQIANAHTTFNVVCTLVWLPLIPAMVKIVAWIVKGDEKREAEAYTPQFLDERMIGQPVAAMCLISKEIQHLSGYAQAMLACLKDSLMGREEEKMQVGYREMYRAVKELQENISGYIERLFAGGALTGEQSEQTAGLLFIANSIDRIADRCEEINTAWEQLRSDGMELSDKAREELVQGMEIAQKLFTGAMESVEDGDLNIAAMVTKEKNRMRKLQKKSTKAHLERVKKKKCDPALTGYYSGILYSLDRMADSCVGIAEEAMDHVTYVKLDEGELKAQYEYAEAQAQA